MSLAFSVKLPRAEYDLWMRWLADSWPTYPADRKTDSAVPPGWFTHALMRAARRAPQENQTR